MTRELLVDGYNVLHAHPRLAKVVSSDLELARARLIEELAEYARATETAVTIVFDGAGGVSDHPTREEVLGVTVVFSARGQSADAVLESLALGAERPEKVTVATSDRSTQEAVFGRGVTRMSARELTQAVEYAEEEQPELLPRMPNTLADRLDQEVIERLRAMIDGG